jgi:hypothetical protein
MSDGHIDEALDKISRILTTLTSDEVCISNILEYIYEELTGESYNSNDEDDEDDNQPSSSHPPYVDPKSQKNNSSCFLSETMSTMTNNKKHEKLDCSPINNGSVSQTKIYYFEEYCKDNKLNIPSVTKYITTKINSKSAIKEGHLYVQGIRTKTEIKDLITQYITQYQKQ